MSQLEKYLKGEPINEAMRRLRDGEDDLEEIGPRSERRENYADGTPITDRDRDQLRRLMVSAGWQVLLKLLDTNLKQQEDAARRESLVSPLSRKDALAATWAELAANTQARHLIERTVETEVEKLEAAKAKKKACATGTQKTPTE